MRNLKRALSLAVSTVMLMGMMVVGSGVASYTDVTSEHNTEAIEVLQAVGVMVGDGESFNPDQNVTREEMAVIMCNLLDLGIANYVGAPIPFTDVPEWAHAYVAACYANGITGGTSDTTYGTDDPITAVQAGLMMLKALGYFQYQGDFDNNGGWILGTVRQAAAIGLYDGIETETEEPLTRNDIAQLALNTLEADMVEFTGDVGMQVDMGNGQSVTVGFHSEYTSRTSSDTSTYNTIDTTLDGTRAIMQLGEDLYDGDLEKDATTNADVMGRPGNTWTYDGQRIGVYAKEADAIYVVDDAGMNVEEILEDGDYFNYTSTQAATATDAKTYLNGVENVDIDVTPDTEDEDVLQKGDVVEVYLNDSSRNVDTVVIARYSVAQIDEVDTDLSSDLSDKGISVELTLVDLDDHTIGSVYYDNTNSRASDAEDDQVLNGYTSDYEAGAYLAVALSTDGNDVIVDSYVIEPATGEPTAARDQETVVAVSGSVTKNGYITVGGTQYPFAGTVAGTSSNFDFESEYNVFATREGYAIGIDGAAGTDLNDVYYVVGLYSTSSDMGTASYYAQTVAMDGTVSSIRLEQASFNAMLKRSSGDNYLYIPNVAGNDLLDGTLATPNTATPEARTLYLPAEASHLYTFTDREAEGDTDGGNGRYTGVAYTGGNDYDVRVAVVDGAISTDDTRFSVDDGAGSDQARFFVNSDSQFIAAEDVGDDLTVSVATGIMKADDDTQVIAISEDANARDASVVIYVGADLSATVATDDVVYLAEEATDQIGVDAYEVELYFMEDNSRETVTIDANGELGRGFYVYDLEDGVYTLTTSGLGSAISSAVDSDTEGWVEDLVITDRYGTTLRDGSGNFVDVDFSSAVILDNRSGVSSSPFRNDIVNPTRLGNAIDAYVDAGQALVADVYVVDGDITLVNVTGSTSADAPVITTQPTDASVVFGSTTSVSVTATVAGTPSYQWYLDGSPVGTDSNSYTTESDLAIGTHSVYVVVTNTENGLTNSTTSDTVTVTVAPVTPVLTAGGTSSGTGPATNDLTLTAGDYENGTYKIYQGDAEATGLTATRTAANTIQISNTSNFDGTTQYTLTVTVDGIESAKSASFTIPAGT